MTPPRDAPLMSEGEAMRMLGGRRAKQDRTAGETPEPTAAPEPSEEAAVERVLQGRFTAIGDDFRALILSELRAAVAREREACARIADRAASAPTMGDAKMIATDIRARGAEPTPSHAPWWALPAEQRRDALSYLEDDCHDMELDGDPKTIEAIRALIALGSA